MSKTDLTHATWRKSTHSGGGNECVEIAGLGPTIAIRDSKNPHGPTLTLTLADWRALAADVKHGEFQQQPVR
jgi:Domain of unknown function (DUF397)